MFTGIVQGMARVDAIVDRPGLRSVELALPDAFDDGLAIGASVACDGVCLTVTSRPAPARATFDVMHASLATTTLGGWTPGRRVNVERAARAHAEVGGHVLSGHVDVLVTVESIRRPDNNVVVRVAVPPSHRRYLFDKGYVALDGCSLTVAACDRDAGWLEVWLIPETLRATTFGEREAGDALNLEVDRATQVVVDSVDAAVGRRLAALLGPLRALLAAPSTPDAAAAERRALLEAVERVAQSTLPGPAGPDDPNRAHPEETRR